MAESDWMRRLRDAGADFTETARARAEELLQDLSRLGEAPLEGDQGRSEELLDLVRQEIRSQLVELGLAGGEEVRELRARVSALDARLSALERESPPASSRASKAASGTRSRTAKAPSTRASGSARAAKTTGAATGATKAARSSKTAGEKGAGKRASSSGRGRSGRA